MRRLRRTGYLVIGLLAACVTVPAHPASADEFGDCLGGGGYVSSWNDGDMWAHFCHGGVNDGDGWFTQLLG